MHATPAPRRATLAAAILAGLALASASTAQAAVPGSSLGQPQVGVTVTCGWDLDRDGRPDYTLTAVLPPQRAARPPWRARCHQARLAVDDTYSQSDLWAPPTTPGPVMHNVMQQWDDDQDGQADDASLSFRLPAQHDSDSAFSVKRLWEARRRLDDTFTQPYPLP